MSFGAIINSVEHVLFLLTSYIFPLALLKYTYTREYNYKYFALLITFSPLAIIGLVFMLIRFIKYDGKSNYYYYLPGW